MLDDYDEIYLGPPNDCGDMPIAVYTFLEAFGQAGKAIHPVCAHEGSGLSRTERKIAAARKGGNVKQGLAICGSYVEQSREAVL